MELTVYEDNLGEDGSILIDRYIDFFISQLQNRCEIDGKTYLEGEAAANAFLNNLTTQLLHSTEFEKWIKDNDLDLLHKEIKGNGMKLCPLNFFTLCQYILAIIKEQYFILLKPTIADTLADLSEVKTITFTNADGSSISSNNSELVKMVMDCVKDVGSKQYEADKFIRVDKITDKILIQSSFAYYVALFLKEYFKDYPRRSNCCMVSATEQKLILYMLYFFGLAPAPLTDSRFRQLIAYFKEHQTRVSYSTLPELGIVPIEMIKYGDWKDGNIKLDKLKFPLQVGDTVVISQDVKMDIKQAKLLVCMWLLQLTVFSFNTRKGCYNFAAVINV